jgi:hypothetical protein
MEARLEALLELCFYTKPPNFGVETHIKAPTGDALRSSIPPSKCWYHHYFLFLSFFFPTSSYLSPRTGRRRRSPRHLPPHVAATYLADSVPACNHR